jgi:hypothetical protein
MNFTRVGLGRAVRGVSLAAAMALIWQSEWQLALAVGWPEYIAWLAPVALDAYLLAAVLYGRDVGAAVMVSAISVAVSHSVYATSDVWASGSVGVGHLKWWAAAVFSAVPLLVAWRVHHLGASPAGLAPTSRRNSKPSPPKATPKREPAPVVPPAAPQVPKPLIGADPSPDPQKSRVASVASGGTPTARVVAEEIALACVEPADVLPNAAPILAKYGITGRTASRARADARAIVTERLNEVLEVAR